MNTAKVLQFEAHRIRTVEKDGNVWWVLSDVAKGLGYRDARDFSRNIKDKYLHTHIMRMNLSDGRSQERDMLCCSEPGLYQGLAVCRKEAAERFQDWVFEEVLPQIRKTGSYQDSEVSSLRTKTLENLTDFVLEQASHTGKLSKRVAMVEASLESLPAIEHDEELYTVSALGKMCSPPRGGVSINRLLDKAGLQRSYPNGKDPSHELLPAGEPYGEVIRVHYKHTGLKDEIVRWKASVLGVIL